MAACAPQQDEGAAIQACVVLGRRSSAQETALAQQLLGFQASRKEEQERELFTVMAAGLRCSAAGILLLVGTTGIKMLNEFAGMVLHTLANAVICAGLLLFCTCPVDRTDLNKLMSKTRCSIRVALGACLALNGCRLAVLFPHAHALSVPFGLAFCLPVMSDAASRYFLGPSSLIISILAIWIAGDGLVRLCIALDGVNDKSGLASQPPSLLCCSAVLRVVAASFIVGRWLWHSFWSTRFAGRWTAASTYSLFGALFVYWLSSGLADVGSAVVLLSIDGPSEKVIVFLLLGGLARSIFPLVVLLVGQKRLFQVAAYHFDRSPERAKRDGAFVAALLDSSGVCAGMDWWEHRSAGDEDASVALVDPRRKWRRGQVVEVRDDCFAVRLEAEPHRGTAEELRMCPLSARNTPWTELLCGAQEQLRCIEWHNLTRSLMTGAICGAADEALQNNRYFLMSRAVLSGEAIDYFISHSWHDDGESKYTALASLVVEFTAKRKRAPTFWLDKVCIDQLNIADGLRMLPLSLMACGHMLVLSGQTYPMRLWCIWELFTLLAFARMEQALERIVLVSLDAAGSAGSASVEECFRKFDVQDARCYDPNEESRLRSVIAALGSDHFNSRIRQLGEEYSTKSSSSRGAVSAIAFAPSLSDSVISRTSSASPRLKQWSPQREASGQPLDGEMACTEPVSSMVANVCLDPHVNQDLLNDPVDGGPMPEVQKSRTGANAHDLGQAIVTQDEEDEDVITVNVSVGYMPIAFVSNQ